MEPDGATCPDARPKRHTRRPSRFEDFDVNYTGHLFREMLQWDTPQPHTRSDRVQPQYSHTPPLYSDRDGAYYNTPPPLGRSEQDVDLNRSLSPEFAPSNLLGSSIHTFHTEFRALQAEREQLLQSQQVLQEGLKELKEAKSDLRELIEVAHLLRKDMAHLTASQPSTNHPPKRGSGEVYTTPETMPQEEDEEVWPDPPPWPEPMEELHTGFSQMKVDEQYSDDGVQYHPLPRTPYFAGEPSLPSHRCTLYQDPVVKDGNTFHAPPQHSVPPPCWAPSKTGLLPTKPVPASSPSLVTGVTSGHGSNPSAPLSAELVYRGPKPTIPRFIHSDPSEFARLRMALENLLPPNATELFKYQILVDHLKLDEARLIADAYLNSPKPYTDTMAALHDKFGQPHQLALRKIASVLDGPEIRRGDTVAFQRFSLQVQSLVGLLQTLGLEGEAELNCGSHVARLISKLPAEQRADFRRHQFKQPGSTYTLYDLSAWLRQESWCQGFDGQAGVRSSRERTSVKAEARPGRQTVTVLHNLKGPSEHTFPPVKESRARGKVKNKAYCAYCESTEHYFSQCDDVAKLSKEEIKDWIQVNKRCWRCARTHLAAQCTLKKPCSRCQGKHLLALHEVNARTEGNNAGMAAKEESCLTSSASGSLYLDRHGAGNRVMLKIVPVLLSHGERTLDTYAILDDGSERTMLLPAAAKTLGLAGIPEDLPLRTVRQDIQMLHGHTVSFSVSAATNPGSYYKIDGAFTADRLNLAHHTYPIDQLRRKYKYLHGIPVPALKEAKPLLLIGSDQPHLITPIEPVRLGPPGGPAAVHTRLGWTLQGPSLFMGRQTQPVLSLYTSAQSDELLKHVERLWQVDVVPYRSEKEVTRSKQDQQAVALLEARTTRRMVDGVFRYATPLLRHPQMPPLNAPKESVMPMLRSTERRLLKDPSRADAYRAEMQKLIQSGAVKEVTHETSPKENWYIPHHLVSHNGKNRLVFNCSHKYLGQSLNQFLLPGPTLGASLLGVLVRFREHPIAVSGDIKGMFHQVLLLPEDRPLLKFLWRDLKVNEPPKIFEWQVLPFGTTSSPCCATFALQHHVMEHTQPDDSLRFSIERCFYVDNCLQSVGSPEEARDLVDRLRELLKSAGFELRQWACNDPSVLSHLPPEARSQSLDLWLAEDKSNPLETTLGLSWDWNTDSLGYKHRPVSYEVPTLRNIYRVLASQYDPLGYLLPFTTRAKLLLRQLWDKKHGWDDSNLPSTLLQAWSDWEVELQFLPHLTFPRAYVPASANLKGAIREVHIFGDASEKAYGAVSYMRTVEQDGQVHLTFILARSRVAPKRALSIPRLELCGALLAAQLASTLNKELTSAIERTVLWSDSTTVLTWLSSQSCRYKVFVGARVAEIQELTEHCTWRYIDSESNPADDLTRGKALAELKVPNRWSNGPPFLLNSPDTWPENPSSEPSNDELELRKTVFCGTSITSTPTCQDGMACKTWQELLDITVKELCGQGLSTAPSRAEDYQNAEQAILRQAQQESFPEECRLLSERKPVSSRSRLLTLAPELDTSVGLIRVGGRLRRLEGLDGPILHPIVLDPSHPFTRLLIQKYDVDLHHPGPERVFAELRRSYWILRGREAIRKHQRTCPECQRWRAQPSVPKMADLPAARLRLYKPAFYSTGVDCFGPMFVKVGRRHEKRWGIIFKCMTTRAVHLDLLSSLDADAFLMALRRFIARRGTPAELWSDCGTNFKGGERELREAFANMSETLQGRLARQKIRFQFNPPAAPHFGGVWEREIRSVKTALRTCVGSQPLHEEVLRTVLLEVELILNAKPLGYVSTDVADVDPVTPNSLLMGRPDGSLPQVVYSETENLSRRRWRHSQILADQFWARFIREYLPGLQARQKWQSTPPELLEKAVIMVADPQLPRALWPIGHVIKVHRSDDGLVRSADVNVNGRVYTRPVARLVVLPAVPSEDSDTKQNSKSPPSTD